MIDYDWAGYLNRFKSVTGIVVKVADETVLYKSYIQEKIALSSTEAEFIATVETGK